MEKDSGTAGSALPATPTTPPREVASTPSPAPPELSTQAPAGPDLRRTLSFVGLGAGLGCVGAGVGLVAHSSRVQGIAEEQAGTAGLAPNQQDYVDGLRRDLLVSGAVLGTVGLGLVVAGSVGLVRSHKRRTNVTANVTPRGATLTVQGRF